MHVVRTQCSRDRVASSGCSRHRGVPEWIAVQLQAGRSEERSHSRSPMLPSMSPEHTTPATDADISRRKSQGHFPVVIDAAMILRYDHLSELQVPIGFTRATRQNALRESCQDYRHRESVFELSVPWRCRGVGYFREKGHIRTAF
ncbi:hypothetical protein MRB53_037112 [Persea americana]|nr:hypothetical protein MRB53_037112 [Persea americana]